MENVYILDQSTVNRISDEISTPILTLSIDQIEYNYNFLLKHIPNLKVFYAMKANPDENIINSLNNLNSNFDVASINEILQLIKLGISPDRLIYANPVKSTESLLIAKENRVNTLTFDCEQEIYKIAKFIPNAKVLLRIKVDTDAVINLNKKFGADVNNVINLLSIAKANGLNPIGLSFHVGSNCSNVNTFINALNICSSLFQETYKSGIELSVLDIGGGFVASNSLHNDLEMISNTFYKLFKNVSIWAEPGRFICANACNLITTVIGKTIKNDQFWYWLDDGIYGTFSGVTADHWIPNFVTYKNTVKKLSTFVGPSCDSLDIIQESIYCEELEIGDVIMIPNAGAYTHVTSTTFNGFDKAKIVLI